MYAESPRRTSSKVKSRRETLVSFDEIPIRDVPKSKSGGGTATARRLKNSVRRSCPDLSNTHKHKEHFRRHSESRQNFSQSAVHDRKKSTSTGNAIHANSSNRKYVSALSIKSTGQTANNLSRNIYNLWKNGQLCDVIINADGTQFYVHRLVMAATCEQFARHEDTMKQKICQYDVPNVSASVMDEVLNFFYTSMLNITVENVEELLETSQNLGIKKLLDLCIEFLMKFDLSNVVRNRSIAQRFGMNGVLTAIDKYIHQHFSSLVTTSSFLQSEFQLVYDIISSDILTKPIEIQIFHACAQWIYFDIEERIKYAVPLMRLIRFVLIPAPDIVSEVEPAAFIFEIPECRDMLYNAFRHQALFNFGKESSRLNMEARSEQHVSVNNTRQHYRPTAYDGQRVSNGESDGQSSNITESSQTETSAEYFTQRPEMSGNTKDEDAGNSNDVLESTDDTSEVIVSKSLDRSPIIAQTLQDSGVNQVFPDAKLSAHDQSRTIDSTSQPARTGNSQTLSGEMKEHVATPCMEELTQRVSMISVRNRRLSRNEPATFSDLSKPTSKTSVNCGQKIETVSQDSQHSDTENENGQSQLIVISSSIRNNSQQMSQAPPGVQHSLTSGDKLTRETEQSMAKSKHSSLRITRESNKSLEIGPSIQQHCSSIRNHIELSPIKYESSTYLPVPPLPRVIIVVGGGNAYNGNSSRGCINHSIQQLDPELNTWSLRSQLPVPVHYCGVTLLNGCIYVTGGLRSSNSCKTNPVKLCYKYDVTKDQWCCIAHLKTARSRHAAITLNGNIYAIGGEDCDGMSCKTLEIYNPVQNSWTNIGSMHEARVGLSAVAHRDRLLVAGGMMDVDEKLLLDTVEVYDLRRREWAFRYPLPVAVCDSSMVEIAGVVYLIGGYVMRDRESLSLNSIFRYSDETDSWESYMTLNVPRHHAVVAAMDSKLYIIGGESSATMGRALSNVECIDLDTDDHIPGIAPLLAPTYGIGGCAFDTDS